MKPVLLFVSLLALPVSCTKDISAAEWGAELFRTSNGFSKSTENQVSCAMCHQTAETPDPNRVDAGYGLHGAAARTAFWGGQADTLDEAVETCLTYFMRSAQPLDRESDEAIALWEFFQSITPVGAPSDPLPLTVVGNALLVPLGDKDRGEVLFRDSCVRCHGQPHSGDGKIDRMAVTLPEFALDEYPEIFPGVDPNLVIIEKVRHGRFFETPGVMPLYSLEALSDEQLGDILAFLDLTGS